VGFILVFIIMMVIFGIAPLIRALTGSVGAANTNVGSFDRLSAAGIPARGLVLTSSKFSTGVTMNLRRFERRTMTLDVEIPGRPPYICTGDFLIPRGLVEATPGTSLELAVDPRNANNVVVLGPGGFTGPWLNLGPPQPY
jgi:hypothetical protein